MRLFAVLAALLLAFALTGCLGAAEIASKPRSAPADALRWLQAQDPRAAPGRTLRSSVNGLVNALIDPVSTTARFLDSDEAAREDDAAPAPFFETMLDRFGISSSPLLDEFVASKRDRSAAKPESNRWAVQEAKQAKQQPVTLASALTASSFALNQHVPALTLPSQTVTAEQLEATVGVLCFNCSVLLSRATVATVDMTAQSGTDFDGFSLSASGGKSRSVPKGGQGLELRYGSPPDAALQATRVVTVPMLTHRLLDVADSATFDASGQTVDPVLAAARSAARTRLMTPRSFQLVLRDASEATSPDGRVRRPRNVTVGNATRFDILPARTVLKFPMGPEMNVSDTDSEAVVEVTCEHCWVLGRLSPNENVTLSARVRTWDWDMEAGEDYVALTGDEPAHQLEWQFPAFKTGDPRGRERHRRFVRVQLLPNRAYRRQRSLLLQLINVTVTRGAHRVPIASLNASFIVDEYIGVTVQPSLYCGPGFVVNATRTRYYCDNKQESQSYYDFVKLWQHDGYAPNASYPNCRDAWAHFGVNISAVQEGHAWPLAIRSLTNRTRPTRHEAYAALCLPRPPRPSSGNGTGNTTQKLLHQHLQSLGLLGSNHTGNGTSNGTQPEPGPEPLSNATWCAIMLFCETDCEIRTDFDSLCSCPFDRTGPTCSDFAPIACSLTLHDPSPSTSVACAAEVAKQKRQQDAALGRLPSAASAASAASTSAFPATASSAPQSKSSDSASGSAQPAPAPAAPGSQPPQFAYEYDDELDGDRPCFMAAAPRLSFVTDCRFVDPVLAQEGPDAEVVANLTRDGFVWDTDYASLAYNYSYRRVDPDSGQLLLAVSSLTRDAGAAAIERAQLRTRMLMRLRAYNFLRLSDQSQAIVQPLSAQAIEAPGSPGSLTTFTVDLASLGPGFKAGGRVYMEADFSVHFQGLSAREAPVWRQYFEVPDWRPPGPNKSLPALLWLWILLPLLALLTGVAWYVYREREQGRDPLKAAGERCRTLCKCCRSGGAGADDAAHVRLQD